MATNEAFSRVRIDAQLRDQGGDVLDTNAVRFEYVLPDKTKADYVLCDRNGHRIIDLVSRAEGISSSASPLPCLRLCLRGHLETAIERAF